MKRSSVLFTDLDRRLSLSNNNQNKESTKKRIKNAGKIDKEKNKEIFDNKILLFWCYRAPVEDMSRTCQGHVKGLSI